MTVPAQEWVWLPEANLLYLCLSSPVSTGGVLVFQEIGNHRFPIHELQPGQTQALISAPADSFSVALLAGDRLLTSRQFQRDLQVRLDQSPPDGLSGHWNGCSSAALSVSSWTNGTARVRRLTLEATRDQKFSIARKSLGAGDSWQEALISPSCDGVWGPSVRRWFSPVAREVNLCFRRTPGWEDGYLEISLQPKESAVGELPTIWLVRRDASGAEQPAKPLQWSQGQILEKLAPEIGEEVTLVASDTVRLMTRVVHDMNTISWPAASVRYGYPQLQKAHRPIQFKPAADSVSQLLVDSGVSAASTNGVLREIATRLPGVVARLRTNPLKDLLSEAPLMLLSRLPIPVLEYVLDVFGLLKEHRAFQTGVTGAQPRSTADELGAYLASPHRLEGLAQNPGLLPVIAVLGFPREGPISPASVLAHAAGGDQPVADWIRRSPPAECRIWTHCAEKKLDLKLLYRLRVGLRIEIEEQNAEALLNGAALLDSASLDGLEQHFISGTALHTRALALQEARRNVLQKGSTKLAILRAAESLRSICSDAAAAVRGLAAVCKAQNEDPRPLELAANRLQEGPAGFVQLAEVERQFGAGATKTLDPAAPEDGDLRIGQLMRKAREQRIAEARASLIRALSAFDRAAVAIVRGIRFSESAPAVIIDTDLDRAARATHKSLSESLERLPDASVRELVEELGMGRVLRDCNAEVASLQQRVKDDLAASAIVHFELGAKAAAATGEGCLQLLKQREQQIALRLMDGEIRKRLRAEADVQRARIVSLSEPARQRALSAFGPLDRLLGDARGDLRTVIPIRENIGKVISEAEHGDAFWRKSLAGLPDELRKELGIDLTASIDAAATRIRGRAKPVRAAFGVRAAKQLTHLEALVGIYRNLGESTEDELAGDLAARLRRIADGVTGVIGPAADNWVPYPAEFAGMLDLVRIQAAAGSDEQLVAEAETRLASRASVAIDRKCQLLGEASTGVKATLSTLLAQRRWDVLLPALASIPKLASLLELRRNCLCEMLTPPMAALLWIGGDDALYRALSAGERLSRNIEDLMRDESALREAQELFKEAERLRVNRPKQERWRDLRKNLWGELYVRIEEMERDPETRSAGNLIPRFGGDRFTWLSGALRAAGYTTFGADGPSISSAASLLPPADREMLLRLLERHRLVPGSSPREQRKGIADGC